MKPAGYEDCLSEYKVCLFDPSSGEPIGWGYELIKRISEERYWALRDSTDMVYGPTGQFTMEETTWRVIVKRKYLPY